MYFNVVLNFLEIGAATVVGFHLASASLSVADVAYVPLILILLHLSFYVSQVEAQMTK